MKIEGDFVWGKASAAVKVDTSVTSTSTTGGSSTRTNVQTDIKSYEGSSMYNVVVNAFTWKDVTVTWQRFQVSQGYTATALCMDKDDHVIERKTVSGTWKGAYLSQSEVSSEDRTPECPTALKCECAGLQASYLRQGIECSDTVTGTGQFCYVRKDAPCANKEQLDALDAPVVAGLFRKSGDPCGSSPTFSTSDHFTTLAVVSPMAAEEPTCSTLPGHSLNAPGDSHRVILDGRCGFWTCKDDGTFDVAQCAAVEKQSGDCVLGGQVVKNSENLPIIYGTDGCITATCRDEELGYSECDDAPTTCEEMAPGVRMTVTDANGICIEAECEDGLIEYSSCLPSNVDCILPNYDTLTDGDSRAVYEQAVCSEFVCSNGILDVRPCGEGSLAAPLERSMAQVGSLMDRLGRFLTTQGLRR